MARNNNNNRDSREKKKHLNNQLSLIFFFLHTLNKNLHDEFITQHCWVCASSHWATFVCNDVLLLSALLLLFLQLFELTICKVIYSSTFAYLVIYKNIPVCLHWQNEQIIKMVHIENWQYTHDKTKS